MSRYLRSEPVCCLWRVSLAALCLSFTLSLARGATLVQDFYLPMPEAQISQANNTIVSGSAGAVNSTFSILVTGDNTVIYYDQWEDGYETDLSNPTQSTTQIWGDGNDAHGIPPGFAHNPLGLPAGTVITLTNSVSLPRNPSQILWDARDHIAATKALVITRAAWPTSIGPVFAGAVGVLSTLDYGTNYISPVGQNMTNGLFKYVGLFIMAAQDNTSVLIDPNGNGVGTTNIVLNQGESYLVNGGIMTGGRVTATKPVQADLVIGDTKNDYASDWFTLYPVQSWSSSYYTPVSSAATQNQPAYVYLFNPNTNSIIINYSTLSGSGSFSIPATNGVFQFQMPVASGASFSNLLGENFFAICTVAANPQNDTAYNWGFTLVPKAALTTQADVGWGPGSAQTNVDGSPVWVTAVAPTTVYVCYNGGTNGLLVDPDGNNYDTNFTLTTLQSQKIYAPSKTQTGMKLYTLNGVLITAAWGEDADVASAGNPYIDAGTTVIPFPVPTLIKTAVIVTDTPPAGLSLGDTIEYSVTINNSGLLPLGNTLVIDAPTTNLLYLTNSTTYNGTPIPDSTGSQPFPLSSPGYTVPVILSQGTSTFTYLAQVVAPGAVSNSVNIGGTAIFSQAYLPPAITNGASIQINFTDTNRVPVGLYSAGTGIYVTVTNTANDATSTNITVSVQDTTHGDVENIVLTETTTNSGVFRNITGLPSSATAGLSPQDGTLNVTPGDTLSVSYTDPIYGDSASNTAAIQIPALLKQLYLSFTNGPQNLDRIDPVAYLHGPIHTSVDIGPGSSSGVVGLAVTNAVTATTGTSVTVPINIGSGNNRLLLVGLSGRGLTNTAVTFNGVGMTLVGVASNNGVAPYPQIAIWSMVNPPAISNNVVASFTGSLANGVVVGAAVFTNVNQATPYGTYVASNNAATTSGASIAIASAANQLVFDTMEYDSSTVSTPGAGQTALFSIYTGVANNVTGASICPGAASVTATWSNGTANRHWTIGAISLMPATTNVTSFTQTPVFCSSFVMPSNNLVTITNYITVTNGFMPANPAVTATLQYNGINFLTLTNPTYSSTASNLIWSTLLSSNVTVPPGQAITYVITNDQAGTAFHVNYDSTNAQSKITLPTSTAIQIETFAVYDAPNPGGNLVITPTAGSTLYVRATVTDPFGTYDITGLGVAITAPVPSANLNTNLTAANIVADDGTNRTYEVAWTTGPTTGNFSIVATANEGTEGITATATASVSPITLDLGTPNTTEFTSGNDGVATNAYPGVASGSVCILVQDLGAITNPVVIQMVTATVISSAGDSELLTLTETATNTGIFTGCINTSTNGPDIPNDGLLYAPAGSLLTASYTNTTYPSQTSSANASILPPTGTPGVKIIKTIASPSGGDVGVGQPVVFNLKVINSGSTVLGSVTVTDNFPSSALSYSTASLTPSATTANSLTWTNLGGLIPGQSTNLTVTFTALVTGLATNFATANGGTATNTSSASILVTHTALNITKLVLSPTNSPVSVGSNIVFRLLIQNVGNTVIPTLPLEDNFSGAYFSFVTSTIPPNGSGYGSLIWTNLASPAALATNATITNDITMTVVGQGNPANNTAVADYAVDAFGNSVPTATGSTNVITAAATISGYVYNDKDQSGTLTAGDTPLSGVTIQIYTDPTGTGTPGTLVQETTTSSGGYYELDNLALGHYVVAETDLPGFANTVPSNGRLPFNLTTLTTSANNYFFQYQPNTSAYSTYSGRVINDLLGTGSNTNQAGLVNVTVNLVQDLNSNGIADPGEPVIYSDSTDGNGNYSFSGVVPGHYVIQEADLYGYYSTGDSQPPNDNQISFITTTNGVTSTTNFFYERLSPVAVNDTNSGFYLVPVIISPLTNDLSPNGDPLTISNAFTANGILVINPGSTNLTFTPTNFGVDTIIYTNADAHGGTSTAVITVTVTALADLSVAKSASAAVPATSNLTYTISVTNLGPSGAATVTVTDTVPVGTSFVGASAGSVNNGGVIVWSLGNLTNGAVSNLTLTVTAPANGTLTNVATVGSPTPDPVLTNNATPPVTTTVTPQADLQIGKSAASSVLATSNLVYTISVTNFGPSVASSVTVTDSVPFGASFIGASAGSVNNSGVIVWSLGNLASGAISNVTLTVAAPASGTLTNVASVGSPTGDPVLTNNTTPPVVSTVTSQADLQIGKSASSSVLATSNLVYTISVTNFGPSVTSSVTVTDTVPVGAGFISASTGSVNNSGVIVWSLGNLASGAASNVTLTVSAPSNGTLTNVATVGSPTGDPVLTNNVTPPVVTTVTPLADLAVGKTAPASALAASNLTYTISVTNFGPSTASSVTVTDSLPVGASFVSASPGSVNNGGIIVWNLGDLANGAVSNVTLTVTASPGGTLTNVATVGSPTGDPALTNNVTPPVTTTVVPLADLTITKLGPPSANAGSTFIYTIIVMNTGPSSASSVVVTDAVPAGLTVNNVTGGGVNNFGVLSWNLGTLASGQSSNVFITVTAPASGTLTNIASVASPTGDTNLANNISTPVITTVTPVADVSVLKSGPAGMVFNTDFNYTISVSNAGPSTASSLIVTDSLPAGLMFVSSVPVTTTNASDQVIWNLGNFPANTSSNLTLTVISTQFGSLTNLASGGSPTLDPVPTNNIAPPVVTTVTNDPPIANPDSYAITENTTNIFSPLVNDVVQTPGGTLTIIAVSSTNGAVSILNNTNVVFTPATNFVGTTVINYTITDNIGGTNSSTITVLVTNIPPIANPDTYSMAENGTNTLTPLVNDLVETPGGTLQIIGVSPTNGTAAILNLTNVVFTPTHNFVGVATIGYTITDSIGGTNTSLITINVTNIPPIAFAQSVSTTENTALPITLTGSDPAGQPLTYIIASGPSGGTITGFNTNTGALTYTPTNNFTGTDTFTFHVNNGYNNSPNVTVTIAVSPVADLLVAQSGPTSGVAGANLIFTVAVTNLGPASATNIIVTNQLDAGYTFVSASAGGATNGSRQVIWTIPVLPANGASNLTVTLTTIEGGIFTNVASGISITPDLNPANNNGSETNAQVVTTVSSLADVAVFKNGTTSVLAGGTVNYTITATNFGPSTASNVIVSDTLPPGVTAPVASGNYIISGNVITWAAALLPGGTATNFTVTVTAPFGGTLTNIASSTSDTADPNPGNNNGSSPSSVVITPVTPVADLAIGKSAAASVLATSNLVYTISVTNFGPSTASSVTVTDSVPFGAGFVNASAGSVNNAGVIVWSLGDLASGVISNVTLTVAAPTTGTLTNVATVGSPTGDPVLTNNITPPVLTTVIPQADLQIGKTAAASVLATSNLVYTISVTNFGPSLASSVTVTDTVPLGTSFVGASAGSVNNSGVIVWNLGDLASGAISNVTLTVSAPTTGTLTNVAMVGSPTGDPVLTNNITSPVITTVIPQADLQIGKSAPASVLATSNLMYTISVTNFGPSLASSVTVTDTVPVGTSFVSASAGSVNNSGVIVWSLGDLASGAISNVTLTIAAPTTGTLTNVATTGSPTGDPVLTNNITLPVITTVIPQADLEIGKAAAPFVLATSNLLYTISVTNFGPSTASSVTVTDTVPIGASFIGASAGSVNSGGVIVWTLGNLASGAVSNVTLTVATPTSGILINVASAGSPTGDPVLTNNITPPVITTVIPQADVQIGKSAAPSVLATSNLVYTISVTNFGPSIAASVTVTDMVPVGASFIGASAGSVDNSGNIVWSLGNLASGAMSNVTLTVVAPTTGTLTNVATVGSPTGDPVLTNNITPPVTTTVIPQADLQVGKTAAALILATSNLVYTISVTNFGPSTANSVTVTDSVPFGASFVSASAGSVNNGGVIVWSLGNLASGAVSNVTLTVAAPTSGILINVASAGSPTGDPVLTNNITPPVLTVVIPQADLQIGKTAASSVLATSNLVYTISVTNFGPSVANSVTVTDTVPVGASFVSASAGSVNNGGVIVWSLGDLASGAISNVTLTAAAPTSGTLTNVATVGSPTGDPVLTNNITPPVITTVIPQADLQIGKTAASSVLATSNLLYTISVTNFGPSVASSVTITDSVPFGTSFVGASAGSVNNAGVIVWSLGNLASGTISNVTLTVAAPTSGTLTNVATVGSPTGDPVLTNNVTPPVLTAVIPQADLQIGKTAAASVLATSNLVYTISVTNFGPSIAASVTVTDTVPVGASFVGASAGSVNSGGVIVWSLGNLGSGTASNVTLTVAAPASGTLTNVATAGSPTGDPVLTNNITPPVLTTVIPQADLQIGKTAAASVLATSNVVYTISVTNVGPSAASSVTVTDTVPVGASFVSASSGSIDNSGVIVWSLGNLASGAVSNVTLTVTAPTSGTLTNVATVGSPTGDPVLTNNITPPVLTTIIPLADVGLGKSGPLGATFNTNFSYTITVTNFGPSAASGVLVTDTLPAGLVFVSAAPATGTNNIGQVIWILGNFPAGTASNLTLTVLSTARGAVTNIASVGAPTLDPALVNNTSQPVVSQVTNIPPIANPDSYSISENSGTNTFAPLVNDVVLNPGGTLQLISVNTTNGTAVINGTNVLFVPGTNYVGLLTINYTITDNVGGTNSSYITVLVTNIPPIANPDLYTVGENSGTATLNPLANDSVSTPGGILSLVRVSPTNGAANISGTNVLFTPALNFFGVATIGYTITDGIGGTNTSLITVIVTNVPPVANGQSVTTPENVAVQIALTGSDPNHLPLTYAIVANPPNGTLSSLNPSTGTVTYTPGTNYAGSDSFTFRVNNGQTNSATATVSITITPVADLAVTQSGPATGFAGSNLVFTVTVTNLGPATATSLVISNALAAGYNFVSATGGGVDTGNLVIWDLATLPAHGVTNFTVTAFAAQGGAYTNIASGASAVLDLNPTNNNGSQISATAVTMITPVADLVVYKVGGTNVFAGATVSYTITASNAGPSTATSVVVQDTLPAGGTFQSATGTYSVSNGVVTWSGLTLTPGAVTTFNITLLASANVTSFINIASGTSPVFDPNPTNNNGSNILSRVITKVTPSADVIAAIFGPATAFLGSNIVFTVTLTNAGPSTASNVVVEDLLPPNLLFVSASNGGTNSNGTNASGTITWPPILALFAGESTNFTFTARSLLAGIYTNVVSSTSTTYDPNPTNNTGVLPSAQAETQVSQPQFTITAGTPVFNPQDGLYEEQVTVTNTGSLTVPGFQLYVTGLRNGVSLYNAVGTNNGTPYVQYGYPLDPSNSVHFVLEFYDPSRQAFTNGLYAVAYMPTNGTISGVSNGVPVTIFEDDRSTPPRMVLEWPSVIGTTYLVIYATTPNATTWNIATPSITATANITQWYDDGPPKTQSAPLNSTARFYRVIQY